MNRQRAFNATKPAPPGSSKHASGTFPAAGTANHAEIHDFFDRFAAALTRGDGATIASMWETPGLVIADAGTHAVSSAKEIEEFYALVKHQYALEGVLATRAEIVRIERPSERILQVLVRWPYLDRHGNEHGDESTMYVLRRDDTGEPKVRIAIVESPSRTSIARLRPTAEGNGHPTNRTH